jgi:FkbM family methyltransferase
MGLFHLSDRSYFIDVGGHVGKSIQRFRKSRDKECEFRAITFEPNPDKEHLFKGFKNHTLLQYAAWIKDEDKEFFIGKENYGDGSTLLKQKTTGILNKKQPILVHCIDFSQWLKDNFSKDDFLIVKFNIEGSEYPVLEKLMKDGTINLIKELIVHWHWYHIKMSFEDHKIFVSKLDKYDNINKKYFSNGEKYQKRRGLIT